MEFDSITYDKPSSSNNEFKKLISTIQDQKNNTKFGFYDTYLELDSKYRNRSINDEHSTFTFSLSGRKDIFSGIKLGVLGIDDPITGIVQIEVSEFIMPNYFKIESVSNRITMTINELRGNEIITRSSTNSDNDKYHFAFDIYPIYNIPTVTNGDILINGNYVRLVPVIKTLLFKTPTTERLDDLSICFYMNNQKLTFPKDEYSCTLQIGPNVMNELQIDDSNHDLTENDSFEITNLRDIDTSLSFNIYKKDTVHETISNVENNVKLFNPSNTDEYFSFEPSYVYYNKLLDNKSFKIDSFRGKRTINFLIEDNYYLMKDDNTYLNKVVNSYINIINELDKNVDKNAELQLMIDKINDLINESTKSLNSIKYELFSLKSFNGSEVVQLTPSLKYDVYNNNTYVFNTVKTTSTSTKNKTPKYISNFDIPTKQSSDLPFISTLYEIGDKHRNYDTEYEFRGSLVDIAIKPNKTIEYYSDYYFNLYLTDVYYSFDNCKLYTNTLTYDGDNTLRALPYVSTNPFIVLKWNNVYDIEFDAEVTLELVEVKFITQQYSSVFISEGSYVYDNNKIKLVNSHLTINVINYFGKTVKVYINKNVYSIIKLGTILNAESSGVEPYISGDVKFTYVPSINNAIIKEYKIIQNNLYKNNELYNKTLEIKLSNKLVIDLNDYRNNNKSIELTANFDVSKYPYLFPNGTISNDNTVLFATNRDIYDITSDYYGNTREIHLTYINVKDNYIIKHDTNNGPSFYLSYGHKYKVILEKTSSRDITHAILQLKNVMYNGRPMPYIKDNAENELTYDAIKQMYCMKIDITDGNPYIEFDLTRPFIDLDFEIYLHNANTNMSYTNIVSKISIVNFCAIIDFTNFPDDFNNKLLEMYIHNHKIHLMPELSKERLCKSNISNYIDSIEKDNIFVLQPNEWSLSTNGFKLVKITGENRNKPQSNNIDLFHSFTYYLDFQQCNAYFPELSFNIYTDEHLTMKYEHILKATPTKYKISITENVIPHKLYYSLTYVSNGQYVETYGGEINIHNVFISKDTYHMYNYSNRIYYIGTSEIRNNEPKLQSAENILNENNTRVLELKREIDLLNNIIYYNRRGSADYTIRIEDNDIYLIVGRIYTINQHIIITSKSYIFNVITLHSGDYSLIDNILTIHKNVVFTVTNRGILYANNKSNIYLVDEVEDNLTLKAEKYFIEMNRVMQVDSSNSSNIIDKSKRNNYEWLEKIATDNLKKIHIDLDLYSLINNTIDTPIYCQNNIAYKGNYYINAPYVSFESNINKLNGIEYHYVEDDLSRLNNKISIRNDSNSFILEEYDGVKTVHKILIELTPSTYEISSEFTEHLASTLTKSSMCNFKYNVTNSKDINTPLTISIETPYNITDLKSDSELYVGLKYIINYEKEEDITADIVIEPDFIDKVNKNIYLTITSYTKIRDRIKYNYEYKVIENIDTDVTLLPFTAYLINRIIEIHNRDDDIRIIIKNDVTFLYSVSYTDKVYTHNNGSIRFCKKYVKPGFNINVEYDDTKTYLNNENIKNNPVELNSNIYSVYNDYSDVYMVMTDYTGEIAYKRSVINNYPYLSSNDIYLTKLSNEDFLLSYNDYDANVSTFVVINNFSTVTTTQSNIIKAFYNFVAVNNYILCIENNILNCMHYDGSSLSVIELNIETNLLPDKDSTIRGYTCGNNHCIYCSGRNMILISVENDIVEYNDYVNVDIYEPYISCNVNRLVLCTGENKIVLYSIDNNKFVELFYRNDFYNVIYTAPIPSTNKFLLYNSVIRIFSADSLTLENEPITYKPNILINEHHNYFYIQGKHIFCNGFKLIIVMNDHITSNINIDKRLLGNINIYGFTDAWSSDVNIYKLFNKVQNIECIDKITRAKKYHRLFNYNQPNEIQQSSTLSNNTQTKESINIYNNIIKELNTKTALLNAKKSELYNYVLNLHTSHSIKYIEYTDSLSKLETVRSDKESSISNYLKELADLNNQFSVNLNLINKFRLEANNKKTIISDCINEYLTKVYNDKMNVNKVYMQNITKNNLSAFITSRRWKMPITIRSVVKDSFTNYLRL